MSAMFFYGYCPLQVPAGKLGDKIGPRKVLIAAMIICTMCVFAFAFPSHRYLLYISRFGVGAASAFAYIGPIMLAKMWLDKKYIASTVGLIQTLGCLGAIVSGRPVQYLAQNFGWQQAMIISGIISLAITMLFCIILEEKPKNAVQKDSDGDLKVIIKNPQTWYIAIAGFALWAPMSIIAETYGISFLERAQNTSLLIATTEWEWVWYGAAIGSPIIGLASDMLKTRKKY